MSQNILYEHNRTLPAVQLADELGTSINNFIKEAIEKEIEFAH
jgi:predicted DNA-binding protein